MDLTMMNSVASPATTRRQDSKSRLERAKYQYENLLMHAGSNLLLDGNNNNNSSNSNNNNSNNSKQHFEDTLDGTEELFTFSRSRGAYPAAVNRSPVLPTPHKLDSSTESIRFTEQDFGYSPPYKSRARERDATRYEDVPALSEAEKNDVILQLQEENERLRFKLNSVIDSAEQSLQEAQEMNDELNYKYDQRVGELEEENSSLREENETLRDMLSRTQASFDVERESLKKTLRILDQMRKRSRDYLEVQKKTHQILTAPEGLHYTMYTDHSKHHVNE